MRVAMIGTGYVGLVSGAVGLQPEKADWVFLNGRVYTVEPARPWAEAVAVRGERIVFCGSSANARGLIGPKTRTVDLKGRMLLPGFVESHIHPTMAWVTLGADLQHNDLKSVLGAVKGWAERHPDARVVRGFGWRYQLFPATGPQKRELDALLPNRPVVLVAIDGHSAWVNSRALKLAGISAQTPDPQPPFSTFQRDPQTREPTGYLVEGPAILQVLAALEPPDDALVARAMKDIMPRFAAAGITSICDAGILGISPRKGFAMYQDLERAEKLSVRVVGSYYYNNPAEDPLPLLRQLRDEFHSDLVQARLLKINVDGGDAQYTAAMLQPYADNPATRGGFILPIEVLQRVVSGAHAAGISTYSHAFGDGAVRAYLDAVQAARALAPDSRARHTACHLGYVHDADIPRFARLGVTAQFSAQWATPDPANLGLSLTRLGESILSTRFMRIGSIARSGGKVAFGTDWPAAGYYSSFKPLEALQVAVTREMLSVLGPGVRRIMPPAAERISLEQALKAQTMGSAYVLEMEDRIGSIRVGKAADLIVLDRNLFEVDPAAISKARVVLTMMNGKITHRDGY